MNEKKITSVSVGDKFTYIGKEYTVFAVDYREEKVSLSCSGENIKVVKFSDLLSGFSTQRQITEFTTGAIRDTGSGKEDYIETLSWLALRRYAKYMTDKASVYGRGNWIKGIPEESYEMSALRHLQKYIALKHYGLSKDEAEKAGLEPNEDHLSAIIFNIQGLMHEQEIKRIKNETKE